MRLSAEQKEAFARVNRACSIVDCGRGKWRVHYPYRDINGPTTESDSMGYIAARQRRARIVAFKALVFLGWTRDAAQAATDWRVAGRAIDIFKRAFEIEESGE